MLLFFFSSRRRHTRLTCDWSSDVCSSDLGDARAKLERLLPLRHGELGFDRSDARREAVGLVLEVLQDDVLARERPVSGEVRDRSLDLSDRDAESELRVAALAGRPGSRPDDIAA